MLRYIIFVLGISLLFMGCGTMSNTNTSTSATATPGSGQVVITTDHTTYSPSDAIVVTVKNTRSTPIYAMDTLSSCSILSLEQQVNGAWQASQVAQCPIKRPARPVKIDAGATYTATITAGYPGLQQRTFPVGSYQLVLSYTTSPSGIPSTGVDVPATSATFLIQ